MNDDALDIVLSFIKRSCTSTNVIRAVNRRFYREFKDSGILTALTNWLKSDCSFDFFREETMSESIQRYLFATDSSVHFSLLTGQKSMGYDKHNITLRVERGSVVVCISSEDVHPAGYYTRTFPDVRSLQHLKHIFKHTWLDISFFEEGHSHNVQMMKPDGNPACFNSKYVCFNQ
jgi:hypothetical protein